MHACGKTRKFCNPPKKRIYKIHIICWLKPFLYTLEKWNLLQELQDALPSVPAFTCTFRPTEERLLHTSNHVHSRFSEPRPVQTLEHGLWGSTWFNVRVTVFLITWLQQWSSPSFLWMQSWAVLWWIRLHWFTLISHSISLNYLTKVIENNSMQVRKLWKLLTQKIMMIIRTTYVRIRIRVASYSFARSIDLRQSALI